MEGFGSPELHQLMLTQMMLAASRQGIVTSDLRLHLDAGNLASYPGSGTTWTDIGPNGLNGTLTNGPTYDSNNGGSIVFDGSNDYVTCGTSSLLDIVGAISIDAWIYPTGWGVNGVGRILDRRVSASNLGWSFLLQQPNSAISFQQNSATGVNSTSNVISLNTWIHVAVTYDATNVRFFINGAFTNSGALTVGNSAGSISCNIGNRNELDRSFAGRIASVALYARALSDAEVAKNFNAKRGRYGL